jgi:hypothetical protein
LAVIVIPKDVNQLARVAKLPARLLMLTGRIYKKQSFEISLQIAYRLCLRALALKLWNYGYEQCSSVKTERERDI